MSELLRTQEKEKLAARLGEKKKKLLLGVVYFDQRTGASKIILWSKHCFLYSLHGFPLFVSFLGEKLKNPAYSIGKLL